MLFRVNKLFNHDQTLIHLEIDTPTDLEIIPEYYSDCFVNLAKLASPLIFTFKFQVGNYVNAYLSSSIKFPRLENAD